MTKNIIMLLCMLAGAAGAQTIEDFSDVSDWYVDMETSSALDGSISVDNGMGALYYELSTATSNDWIHFKKDFATPLDISDPNLFIEFKMLIPNDPAMFVQVRFTDSSNRFIEHYFGSGNGQWLSVSKSPRDTSFWSDYGNAPNLSNIIQMRIEICGDASGSYTDGTVYVDDINANVVSYAVIESFEQLGWWTTSTGPSAGSASVALNSAFAQQGAYCAAYTYGLTSAVGNDYVRMYNDRLSLDLSKADTIDFMINLPNDPHSFVQMKIYDRNGGFIEYTFPEGDGKWKFYSLSIADDFADYGTNPALTDVNLIFFEVNGDISATAVSETIYVDYITAGKKTVDCKLAFDSDGDCMLTVADFASFASQWLSCGWEFAGLCD